MTLFTLNVVQQILQETKHADNISGDSRSDSNISFHIPDALINSTNYNTQNSKQVLSSLCDSPLFIAELGRQKFTISPMVQKYSPVSHFLLVLETGDQNFLEYSLLAKNVAKSRQIVAKHVVKLLQASSLQ